MLDVKMPLFFGALTVTLSNFEVNALGITFDIKYDDQIRKDIQVTEREVADEVCMITMKAISQELIAYERKESEAI